MRDSIEVVKQQANDSITYGTKSGNDYITKKGQTLLEAANKIDKFVHNLDKLLTLTDARTMAVEQLEEISIDKAAARLSPDNYETHDQWKAALDKFIKG